MKAKKVISMFLVGAAALGLLAGCGSENGGSGAVVQQSTSETGTDSAGSRGHRGGFRHRNGWQFNG